MNCRSLPRTTIHVRRFLPTRMPKAGVVRSKYLPGGNDRTDRSVNFVCKFASFCLSARWCYKVAPRKRLSEKCLQLKDNLANVSAKLHQVLMRNWFTKPLLYR